MGDETLKAISARGREFSPLLDQRKCVGHRPWRYGVRKRALRLITARNKLPSRSSPNSIAGYALNARKIPFPSPRYGRTFVAYEVRIGFRMFELPLRMFATVRLFGRWPGLMISIRSSNMKIRMGADTK